MAEKSCRPVFSLPFHNLIVARQVHFSNEVPDQFNLLPAVAAGLIRRMDDNLFYKLIDDGGRQFPDSEYQRRGRKKRGGFLGKSGKVIVLRVGGLHLVRSPRRGNELYYRL